MTRSRTSILIYYLDSVIYLDYVRERGQLQKNFFQFLFCSQVSELRKIVDILIKKQRSKGVWTIDDKWERILIVPHSFVILFRRPHTGIDKRTNDLGYYLFISLNILLQLIFLISL